MEMNGISIGSYKFDIEGVKESLERLDADRVLLQLPDGFKYKADQFADLFDREVVIWGGSSYGACDLPQDIENFDALIHVGHAEIPNLKTDYPLIYMEGRCIRWNDLPDKILNKLEGKVGLYAPVQHVHQLEKAAKDVEKKGATPIISEGDERVKYSGQVLGCNYSAKVEDADHHVYIGTGRFHPLGLSFSLDQDIFMYNPITRDHERIGKKEREDFLRQRFGAIAKLREADTVMLIRSRKPGQDREKIIEDLKSLGEDSTKKMMTFIFDDINPEAVDQFRWDCAVCTACPRIALDDYNNFRTTIITPAEFKIGMKKKERWKMDEIS